MTRTIRERAYLCIITAGNAATVRSLVFVIILINVSTPMPETTDPDAVARIEEAVIAYRNTSVGWRIYHMWEAWRNG